ncbi:MAG: hypothetical protein JO100_14165 [Pseudonocardia sp.]|nr:hypothetical protein [Pseudonocardia sp.]
MARREDVFISLSAGLTGYSPVRLIGTGMCDQYLAELGKVLSDGMVDEFLSAYARPPADGGCSVLKVLRDARWGPVARRVMILWYCGTWTALPESWHAVHGASSADTDHVVSAEAYQAGLQWVAAGAHPAGARQQGFGAWALAPEGV